MNIDESTVHIADSTAHNESGEFTIIEIISFRV